MHNSKLKLEIEELTRTMTIQDIINDSIKDMPDVPQKLLEDIWKNIQDSIARLDDALLGTNVIFPPAIFFTIHQRPFKSVTPIPVIRECLIAPF